MGVVDSRLHDKVQDEMRRLRPLDKAVICRVVNGNDVVPTLAPETMGFRHLDKLVYITDQEKVLINPNLDEQEVVEEQKDKAALKDQVNKVLGQIPSQFKDHMPDLYLGPLEHLFEDVAYTGKDGVQEVVTIWGVMILR